MASPIEDVKGLRGKKLNDQDGQAIGEIKEVYTLSGNDAPMWISVEASTGIAAGREVLVPVSRLKEERGQVRVPYSGNRIRSAPEIDASDELSAEEDRALRDYYAIDLGDQEVRSGNDSYAARVPEEGGNPQKVTGNGESQGGEGEGQ